MSAGEAESLVADSVAGQPLPREALHRVIELIKACPSNPASIGAYRLAEPIGAGGMGMVYRAEQEHPIKRTVALKLIKPGMDSREIIARFQSERQALAMMNHRNVAKVLDAGTSDDGRPYFVMEYVPGESITAYCDRNRYTIKQRLTLFIQACEAVQHAHQKAIIHRDLKPSNILVTGENGDAEVKVIDFGVAKALSPSLEQQQTLHTHTGQLIGTPEYMSPEQAGSDGQGVDTRSDIYSLGVVLYEVLTGALPFDPKTLRSSGVAEIQRIIREVDPPRPSTRLSTLGEGASEIASNRATVISTLHRELRGELEWIPLKAMRKEPERRYTSTQQLAEDIRNYLERKPLLAGPESRVYRTKKFLNRHRAAGTALAVAIALLCTGTALHLHGIRGERDRTLVALEQARVEREIAVAVSRFLTDRVLSGATPDQVPDKTIRDAIAKAVLDPAAASAGDEFARQPLVEAAVRQTLAQSYYLIGARGPAATHAQVAVDLRRRELGAGHPETLTAIDVLATVLMGDDRLNEAESLFREVLECRRRVLGDDHPDTVTSIRRMGALLARQDKLSDAEPLLQEALDRCRGQLGQEDRVTYSAMDELAHLFSRQGKIDAAGLLYREALDGRHRLFGGDHTETLTAMFNLGVFLSNNGTASDAEQRLQEVLTRQRRILGSDHPVTLQSIAGLGEVLTRQGKLSDAEQLIGEALERNRRLLGDEHRGTLNAMGALANLMKAQGKLDQAEALRGELLERRRRLFGDEHLDTLISMAELASVRVDQGKLNEAEPLLRRVLDGRRRLLGNEHPSTLTAIGNLSHLLKARGQLNEAERLEREVLEVRQRVLGDDHPATSTSMNNLGQLLAEMGKLHEAEALLRDALHAQLLLNGPEHPQTQTSKSNLAVLLEKQGKLSEAQDLARAALEQNRRVLGEDHPQSLNLALNLGAILTRQGNLEEAELIFRQCVAGYARAFSTDHPRGLVAMNNLASVLSAQGKASDAETLSRQTLERSRRALGEAHPTTLAFAGGLSENLIRQGKYAEAESLIVSSLEHSRGNPGATSGSVETVMLLTNLGCAQREQGKLTLAKSAFHEAVEHALKTGDERAKISPLVNLGQLLRAQGELDESEQMLRQALAICGSVYSETHPNAITTRYELGRVLLERGALQLAEPLLTKALDDSRLVFGGSHAGTWMCLRNVGRLREAQGRLQDAASHFEELYARARAARSDKPRAARFISDYGRCLVKLGAYVEAEAPLREALRALQETEQHSGVEMRAVLSALIELLEHTGRSDEADQWYRKLQRIAEPPTDRPKTDP